MIIGNLDRKIIIYDHSTVPDGAGQPIATRSIFATVYAGIEYQASDESIHAETTTAKTKILFTIRYLDGLNERMEIYFDSQYFEIISIQPIGRNESIKVMAQKMDR